MSEMTTLSALKGTAATAQALAAAETPQEGEKAAKPLLGGENIKITYATDDLTKLLAQLRNENDSTQLSVAKMRISSVVSLLDSMNVQLSAEQKAAFENMVLVDAENATVQMELSSLYQKYAINNPNTASAIMEAKIEALTKAVERAVQEGKDHQKAVQEAKEIRDADREKLDQLKAAETKDKAAIKAAEENLAAAQATLDAAAAIAAKDPAAISAAQTELDTATTDKARIEQLQTKAAELSAKVSDSVSALGEKALENITNALKSRVSAQDLEIDDPLSPAEKAKEEKREIATDPLKAMRESLDRMDEDMMDTIGENRELRA